MYFLAAGIRQLLGNLLVWNGRITHEQLDQALSEQKLSGEVLGDALIRLGFIDGKERDAVLATQREQQTPSAPASFRLGDILVASGHITSEQLGETLEQQKHSDKKIGELLVERGYTEQNHIDHGIRLQNVLVSAALAATLTLYPPVTATAGGTAASFSATASVKNVARVTVIHQQTQLVVTDKNVSQGYLDIPASSRIEVKNTSPSGYIIAFEVQKGPFEHVFVGGLGTELQISFGNGWMLMPHSRTPVVLELTYRFALSADTAPGTYPWPIQVSALAL